MSEGVCGHSTVVGQSSYVIFEVGGVLEQQQFKSWASENGIGFKALFGSYKGVQNVSFIANTLDYDNIIAPAGWTKREESVLVLGPTDARDRRPGKLLYSYGHMEDLGLFQSVSKKEAFKQDAWTFDPSSNQYFICK